MSRSGSHPRPPPVLFKEAKEELEENAEEGLKDFVDAATVEELWKAIAHNDHNSEYALRPHAWQWIDDGEELPTKVDLEEVFYNTIIDSVER